MTTLVTGATGFIGRHVLPLLLERGDDVVTFGRSAPALSAAAPARHRHIAGDLTSGENLGAVPWREIGQVIHLAAAGVKASRRAWPEALAVNVTGTQSLLEAVRRAPAAPRVFVAKTFYEDIAERNPALLENPYIATKRAATRLAALFADTWGGGVVFGDFFQVYGPGDDPGNVLSYAAREFHAGRAPLLGGGRGLRDWIHVSDAARAVLACLSAPHRACATYDIGSGRLHSIREMVERLHALRPEAPAPVFDPSRDRPDADLARRAENPPPGWTAKISPHEGLPQLFPSP